MNDAPTQFQKWWFNGYGVVLVPATKLRETGNWIVTPETPGSAIVAPEDVFDSEVECLTDCIAELEQSIAEQQAILTSMKARLMAQERPL